MSLFEVTLLILCLLIAISITWSTIAVGISPMPSSKKARQAMLNLCDHTGSGEIVDLGCGWGHFVIAAAKRYPQRKVTGYELSFIPYITALVLKWLFRLKNLTLKRVNFLTADLSTASVLVCYLFPKAMQAIEEKLTREEHNIEYLISNNFACPSLNATQTIRINDFYLSPIYIYQMKNQD